jgi:hypothetical protein
MQLGGPFKLGDKRFSSTCYLADLRELQEQDDRQQEWPVVLVDALLDRDSPPKWFGRAILIVEDETLWGEMDSRVEPVRSLPTQIYIKKHPLTVLSSATHFRNITSQSSWAFPLRGANLTAHRKPTTTPRRI